MQRQIMEYRKNAARLPHWPRLVQCLRTDKQDQPTNAASGFCYAINAD
jgi:hypothetical protein